MRISGPTQAEREQRLTDDVVASYADSDDRPREVLAALTRHLHAFIREVRLTPREWQAGIDLLTATGQRCDDERQEFVMLSDVLGASMQVITVNDSATEGSTEATVLGPFFVAGSPRVELGGDVAAGGHGEPCWVEGTVTDTAGNPVPGARVEVWEADDDGLYDVQRPGAPASGRGHLFTDGAGAFRFWALTPTPYPIPTDGPVGRLLAAAHRSPMRAPHLHFLVEAPGYERLVTHAFVAGDDVGSDAVFGVRDSLVRPFERHRASEPTPDGRVIDGPSWTSTRFDIVLAPSRPATPGHRDA